MAVTESRNPRQQDTYMDLVREFPLKTLKNENEHERATAMISRLMGRELDPGAGDYLDALIVLVSKYEDENHAISEQMTPQEALRALMEANQLNQAQIGRVIGSETAVSMFLKGERTLSKSQIRKLSERFKVEPGVFLA